jgi:hypothetical protein
MKIMKTREYNGQKLVGVTAKIHCRIINISGNCAIHKALEALKNMLLMWARYIGRVQIKRIWCESSSALLQ